MKQGSPRSWCWETLFLACRWPPACCVLTMAEKKLRSLFLSLLRTLIPSWGPTLMTSSKPHYLPKAQLQMSSHCRFWVSIYKILGDTNIFHAFHPCAPQIPILLTCKILSFYPCSPKIIALKSIKSHLKYHFNQLGLRHEVLFIPRQNFSPAVNL